MEEALNICPLCEVDYRPEATQCADCRTPLISRNEYDRAREPLPFSDDLIEIRTEAVGWIRSLAAVLAKAGIRCYVHSAGVKGFDSLGHAATHYDHTLYVRPEHAEAAWRLDRALLGATAEEDVEEEGNTCPACGTPRPPGVEECTACGLFLDEL